jgi:hypothetical protein
MIVVFVCFVYTLSTEKLTVHGVLRLYKLFRIECLGGFYFSLNGGLLLINMKKTTTVIRRMQRLCDREERDTVCD